MLSPKLERIESRERFDSEFLLALDTLFLLTY
jgi:hypothetical protein